MKTGELFWVDLPTSNGREQAGLRPIMVLQEERYAGQLPTIIVIPVTTNQRVSRFPGTVTISATTTNGLRYDSVLLLFQIRVLDRKRLGTCIGAVEPSVLAQIYQTLDRLTGRPEC